MSYRDAAIDARDLAEGRVGLIRDEIQATKGRFADALRSGEATRLNAIRALGVREFDPLQRAIDCANEIIDDHWFEILQAAEEAETRTANDLGAIHDAECAADLADLGGPVLPPATTSQEAA